MAQFCAAATGPPGRLAWCIIPPPAALLGRAEAADAAGEDDPQALPKEIARREALRDKLDAARGRLEAQAQARAAAEREAYEAKVAAREKRRGRAKGKHPKPPTETPAADAQSNLSVVKGAMLTPVNRKESAS